jgi:hypothetical protein
VDARDDITLTTQVVVYIARKTEAGEIISKGCKLISGLMPSADNNVDLGWLHGVHQY